MKKKICHIWFLLVAILCCYSVAASAAQPSFPFGECYSINARPEIQSPRILMVGNSHTASNRTSTVLYELARSAGISATVDTVVHRGHNLGRYAFPGEDKNDLLLHQKLVKKLETEHWDYVILQGSVMETVRQYELFQEAIAYFQPMIEASGAQMVLYMPWQNLHPGGSPRHPDSTITTDVLYHTYKETAQKYHCALAPSGISVARAVSLHPSMKLYRWDEVHLARRGGYLSACTIFATLFQRSPVGLRYNAGLSDTVARQLQQIAEEVTVKHVSSSQDYSVVQKRKHYLIDKGQKEPLSLKRASRRIRIASWTSSNPKVAAVSQKGVVKAKSAGRAVITAILNNGYTRSWEVKVHTPFVAMKSGKSRLLPRSMRIYRWTSSNKRTGYIRNNRIYAGKRGKVILTGKNGSSYCKIRLTVKG